MRIYWALIVFLLSISLIVGCKKRRKKTASVPSGTAVSQPSKLANLTNDEGDDRKSRLGLDDDRKKKVQEAIDNLDKIYKASGQYYSVPHVEKGTGRKIECQFPRSHKMTPDVSNKRCCGRALDADKDNRCDVNMAQWVTDTWSSLNFQMNDQHYFGYAYTSSGTIKNAKFTVSAYADLDCDGTLSTFVRYGYGDESASFAECSMKGSSAFYKDKQYE